MNFIKKTIERRVASITMMILAISFGFLMQSCGEDEPEPDPIGAVPTLGLGTSDQLANTTGSEIKATFTITAPEGLKEIRILKNGVAFKTEAITGAPTQHTFEFVYTIEEPIGANVNFTFTAIDGLDRASEPKVLNLRVLAKPIKAVPAGSLLGTHRWSKDTIYRLNGYVRVGRDVADSEGNFTQTPGELHIEAGTLIIGDKQTKGTLIVQRGSKIFAEGTKDDPIIMTSEAPIGLRRPGDWGGLVMCGRVRNNQGLNIQMEGGYGAWHGGTVELDDENESSGVVKYVRIEYAGIPINPNEEVNSLTMGSVGKRTKIEYVQASYGLDDAFEWFGGSVDCKHLIAFHNLDDDLDVDFGYSGFVQFALVIREPSLADQSGSNGFEVDNNGSGSTSTPFTSGRFANITVIGPKKTRETTINTDYQHGAQLRRHSSISIYNSFITGFPAGIYIDDTRGEPTSIHALNDNLRLRNVILAGVEGWGGNGYGMAFDPAKEGEVAGLPFTFVNSAGETVARPNHPNAPRDLSLKQDAVNPNFNILTWFNTPAYGNMRLAKWQDAGINPTIFDPVAKPDVLPLAGSMLLTAAKWDNIPAADADKFEKVSFSGAFGTTDWTEGWAEWLPQTAVYF